MSTSAVYKKKNRPIENIPPTYDTLCQHIKRASLQANIWYHCLESTPETWSVTNSGWKLNSLGRYEPVWITTDDVSRYCKELVCCTCQTRCKNCKCVTSGLGYTQLCGCEGHCSQMDSQRCVVYENVEEDCEVDNVLVYYSDYEDVETDSQAQNILDYISEDDN